MSWLPCVHAGEGQHHHFALDKASFFWLYDGRGKTPVIHAGDESAVPFFGAWPQRSYLLDVQSSQVYNDCMKEKPSEQKVQVRFSLDLWQEMKQLAKQHARSFNSEVLWALRRYVAQEKGEQKHGEGV